MLATDLPPVMEARRWVEGKTFTPERPLLNVSQAAPLALPPLMLREALAEAALHDPNAHLYGPVLGNAGLRAEVARQVARSYGGEISPAHVAITQGCNQAFCAALSALAGPGDEVILPAPWYFNHKMWFDMQGIITLPLAVQDDMLPCPLQAEALITPNTRAIVLVTPNNPTGAEYPPALVQAFFDLAQRYGLRLVIDETYRDFDSRFSARGISPDQGRAHDLFTNDAWQDTLIQLYSFSKAYRLTGHRVGTIIAAPELLVQIEKLLDTMAICPNQLGQIAALWGMRHLDDWLEGERAEILRRRAALVTGFSALPAWRVKSCGAYFAWVEHPYECDARDLCRRLIDEVAVLTLPGTFFAPIDAVYGQKALRIAFANIDCDGIAELCRRLMDFTARIPPKTSVALAKK